MDKLLNVIIEAIKQNGGTANITKDIIPYIKQNYPDIMSDKDYAHYRANINATIEIHSSDSAVFNGKDDIFYKVNKDQKDGIWGIR